MIAEQKLRSFNLVSYFTVVRWHNETLTFGCFLLIAKATPHTFTREDKSFFCRALIESIISYFIENLWDRIDVSSDASKQRRERKIKARLEVRIYHDWKIQRKEEEDVKWYYVAAFKIKRLLLIKINYSRQQRYFWNDNNSWFIWTFCSDLESVIKLQSL